MRCHPLGGVHEICTKAVLVGKSVSVMLTMIGVTVEDGVSLTSAAAVNVAVGKSNETVGDMGVGVA